MRSSISLQNVSLGYHKNTGTSAILDHLDLEFYPGDFVGVVGMNGVGKSTFLKSLCGLLPVFGGNVFIEGKNISEHSLAELARKIAIVLTENIGGFNLTCYDAVAAGQIPYTNSFNELKPSNRKVIEDAINSGGIREYAGKLLNECSDGQFQKTMIAKSLAQQTPVLLLDEPTAFLDYASKHELFLLLQKLSSLENKCVLVSSHDLDLVTRYCNKLLVVDKQAQLLTVSEAKTNTIFLNIGGGFI